MNKATFARMVGDHVEIEGSTVEEMGRNGEKLIEAVMDDPAYVQVGMNPFRHSYFYDRATMQPVVAAEEVIQVGGLVYAKNVEYASPTDPRFMVMAEPSGKTSRVRQRNHSRLPINRFSTRMETQSTSKTRRLLSLCRTVSSSSMP